MVIFFLFIFACYILGSVNFAIIIFRITGKGDPRKEYSGNAGTTNVFRQAGPGWAVLVLLLDMGRAVGAACCAIMILPIELVPWAGLALIGGNRFPCFHGFNGGKGVANYLGFTLIIHPWATAFSAAAWVVVYFITRKPFLGSFLMVGILMAGNILACGSTIPSYLGIVITAGFIIANHKKNMEELFSRGKERD